MIEQRHYRVVRLIDKDRDQWAVVSVSMRDDATWDVIETCPTRHAAFTYIVGVHERYESLVAAGLA